jgi:Holliday junction resolvase-like predicted endonuclease
LRDHPQPDAVEVRFDVAVVVGAKIEVITAAF